MIGAARKRTLTLAVAPTTRGFGWAVFDGPLSLLDWGSVFARSEKNLRSVRKFERLLDDLQPEAVVMEEPSSRLTRSKRVHELQQLLTSSARLKLIAVETYRAEQVKSCFAAYGAQHHHEIAEAISRQFPELVHKLPRKRAAWMTTDQRMGLFLAVALALTHFLVGGNEATDAMKR